MKIYCARPISGCSGEEVVEYYETIKNILTNLGYNVYIPMVGKGEMRTEVEFKADQPTHDNPLATNHAIYERDKWMVTQSDIVFANLVDAKSVSIGTVMEMAWAALLGKHLVVAMGKADLHRHAFVLESADVVFETAPEAMRYLKQLIERSM